MSLHSPLPWVIYSDRGDIKSVCKGLPEVPVAKVLGQETSGERQANAALIVQSVNALPGLVKALEDIAEFCSSDSSPLGAMSRLIHIQNTARAAVAAAKERT